MRARLNRTRRGWAWPLVPVYAAGLMARDWLRRVGWLRVRRLAWPVISVGSLSAGGAGKTPVVIALVELLRAQGWAVDVLSRGYGRTGRGVERVDLDAEDAAARFGDEPVVIAQRTGVAVWVGAVRFAAGMAAEKYAEGEREAASSFDKHGVQREADSSSSDTVREREADASAALRNDKEKMLRNDKPWRVHLLDDGFQHWGLARAVEVVLVTEEDLEEALLPAGNRREQLTALRRADAVVLRVEERERVEARVRGLMREGAAVWSVRRELRFTQGEAGARTLAFCAIARPEDFWAMLAEAGCQLAGRAAFGDHHAYGMVDMERLVAMAKECGATGFVATEKDAVKLSEAMMERLREVGPVCVAGLAARFAGETDVVREMEERCR